MHNFHSYSEFNLGPLFLLDDLATKVYEMKRREFVFRLKPSGQLATYFTQLKNHVEGAAVDTHRMLEVEKAHLPTTLWKNHL